MTMTVIKRGAKKSTKSEDIREDFIRELKHLRTLVREVGEQFILRREGEVETIISHLEGVPPKILKNQASDWLHEIKTLKLKPAKGRIKDLKGIDEFDGADYQRPGRAQVFGRVMER